MPEATMIYNTLGRTGFRVSVIGIGAGGPSRLGLNAGNSREQAIVLIRAAIDRGINFVDSALTYGTEAIVGQAIRDRRHDVILSTKAHLGPYFPGADANRSVARLSARIGEARAFVASGRAIEERVHGSLRRLMTDYIDLYNLHTVTPAQYDAAVMQALPTLIRLKEAGKIRAIGITEAFPRDRRHKMLARAGNEDAFDSIMVGFNFLNQCGKPIALQAQQSGKGTIAIYVIRASRSREALQSLLDELVAAKCIDRRDGDVCRIADLLASYGISSLPEAAIRFCRHELGADVILCGVSRLDHLNADIAAGLAEPLPEVISAELKRIFGKIDSVTGDKRDGVSV